MRVTLRFILLFCVLHPGCVSVDLNHWNWCKTECDPHGGHLNVGLTLGVQSCECMDGSYFEHDKLPIPEYDPYIGGELYE